MTAVVLVALTAACSTPEAGRPGPEGSDGGTTQPGAPSSAPTTDAELPPRPESLPIDDVDPCSLYTDAQRSELQVVRAVKSTDDGTQAECSLTVETDERNVNVRVTAETREGVSAWLTEPRNVTVEPTTVEGFGAAHFWFKGGSGADCNTAVDVADGQHLKVKLFLPGVGWTQEKLCETTDRFAAAALSTLRAG